MEQAHRGWDLGLENVEAGGWDAEGCLHAEALAEAGVAIDRVRALMVIVYVQNAGRLYPIKGGNPVMNTAARNAAHQ